MAQTLSTPNSGVENSSTTNNLPKTIIKSMGNSEPFQVEKLVKAVNASGITDDNLRQVLIERVLERVKDKTTTSTTFINDIIESYLIKEKKYDILDRYVSNRLEKNKVYADKVNLLGTRLVTAPSYNRKELEDFSVNQIQIAANRYLLKDMQTGEITESMTAWFERVASAVVLGSVVYDPEVYDKEGKQSIHDLKEYNDKKIFQLGYRSFGQPKIELLFRIYKKLNEEHKMRYNFQEFSYKIWDLAYPDYTMDQKYQKLYRKYFQYMYQGIFEPNTPTLMNAGTKKPMLHACFTLSVEDNMRSIGNIWRDVALIYQGAGGFGTNISSIRPKGSNVGSTFGAASGPISLVLKLIDSVTVEVKSGGKRRGANISWMDYDYPQIQEFIDMKKTPGFLENFNVSVLFDEKFWEHYHSGTDYDLKFGDKIYGKMNARALMEQISVSAWTSAEPGVGFKDNVNRSNPLRHIRGDINMSNPCGEEFMYDGESCTLGSINVSKFVREDGTFDWDQYVNVIHETTRFLNDVLEIGMYPTEHIETESQKTKRIGLGIMGLADLLFLLKIPYNSAEGFDLMNELAKTLYIESVKTSIDLSDERGACYWYNKLIEQGGKPEDSISRTYNNDWIETDRDFNSEYIEKLHKYGIRNMWTTTVAPTGTISMIADTSSGLEPIFSLVFSKITNAGKYYYTSELFKQALIQEGIYSQELIEKVERNYGSCKGIEEIPEWMQKVFVTAIDLHWMDHVVAQAIWQNWIDVSISKTINMPYNVVVEDVKNSYILAHGLGLKGISLYRDGSRHEQVLHVGSNVQSNKNEQMVQKDISGTVTIPVKNQVERKGIKPSRYAIDYVKQRIKDEELIVQVMASGTEFTERQKTECPSCKQISVVLDSGCSKCVNEGCGWSACSSA